MIMYEYVLMQINSININIKKKLMTNKEKGRQTNRKIDNKNILKQPQKI